MSQPDLHEERPQPETAFGLWSPSPRIYDISVPLTPGMPSWPGDPTVETHLVDAIQAGEAANVSWVGMCAHSGTHVDAPRHFFDGRASVDTLSLEAMLGPCLVVELTSADSITAADLQAMRLPAGVARLLFKTPNSELWTGGEGPFRPDFIGLAPDAASWLVQQGVLLVGIDYLSIEPYPAPFDHPVHKLLLGAGIIVLEGLDLSRVSPGRYTLICLPLRLAGMEGAPARAVLVEPTAQPCAGEPSHPSNADRSRAPKAVRKPDVGRMGTAQNAG